MTSIQAVFVRGHEERTEPKPHVVYRIEVQSSVRTWQMWRRYSEFTDLHSELIHGSGKEPPSELPPKHIFSFRGTMHNTAILEERRSGLESYLRAIVGSKDDRWRENLAFKNFLGIPIGRAIPAGGEGASSPQLTPSSWLDEHTDIQAQIRNIREDLNRKDTLSEQGEVSQSQKAGAQAQKNLIAALTRIGTLADSLHTLGVRGLNEGELQRRTDLVGRLKDDCKNLGQMVAAGRRGGTSDRASGARNATTVDRNTLLSSGGFVRPFANAAKVQETDVTRPLDDHGLLNLQQQQISQQDATLAQFTSILQRQKQLGVAINQEVREQIEMLDGLSTDVDVVAGKLSNAKKDLNRLG